MSSIGRDRAIPPIISKVIRAQTGFTRWQTAGHCQLQTMGSSASWFRAAPMAHASAFVGSGYRPCLRGLYGGNADQQKPGDFIPQQKWPAPAPIAAVSDISEERYNDSLPRASAGKIPQNSSAPRHPGKGATRRGVLATRYVIRRAMASGGRVPGSKLEIHHVHFMSLFLRFVRASAKGPDRNLILKGCWLQDGLGSALKACRHRKGHDSFLLEARVT